MGADIQNARPHFRWLSRSAEVRRQCQSVANQRRCLTQMIERSTLFMDFAASLFPRRKKTLLQSLACKIGRKRFYLALESAAQAPSEQHHENCAPDSKDDTGIDVKVRRQDLVGIA